MRAFAPILLLATLSLLGCKDEPSTAAVPAAATGANQEEAVHECPMHCVRPGESEPYTQRGPGPCPVCGMDLVPQE